MLESPALPAASRDAVWLAGLVEEHFAFVWRLLRRLGVCDADADDAAQQVFLLAGRRLSSVKAGSEHGFLFAIVMRMAASARRKRDRRREISDEDLLHALVDPPPGPDDVLQLRRVLALLDWILDQMEINVGAVFVLFEIERLTIAEIAALLGLPRGTVASRLRHARGDFDKRVRQLEAQVRFRGGVP